MFVGEFTVTVNSGRDLSRYLRSPQSVPISRRTGAVSVRWGDLQHRAVRHAGGSNLPTLTAIGERRGVTSGATTTIAERRQPTAMTTACRTPSTTARTIANSDQADLDEDGAGDACDADDDGDGADDTTTTARSIRTRIRRTPTATAWAMPAMPPMPTPTTTACRTAVDQLRADAPGPGGQCRGLRDRADLPVRRPVEEPRRLRRLRRADGERLPRGRPDQAARAAQDRRRGGQVPLRGEVRELAGPD